MNYITDVETARTIKSVGGVINLTVSGDIDAIFNLQILKTSDNTYYNFTTDEFAAIGETSSKFVLKNQSPGYFSFIIPDAENITYTILIWPQPHHNTEFNFGKYKFRRAIDVLQTALTQLTFTAKGDFSLAGISNTALGTKDGYSIDQYTLSRQTVLNVKKQLLTLPSASNQHGFFITSPTISSDLTKGTFGNESIYWETGNYAANGAGTNSTSLTLTSVDDLYIGMQVSYINSVYQSALRAITAINTTTKTVTLDGNETWTDGHAIKFRAYGTDLIESAIDTFISVSNGIVELGQTTTTNRTSLTSDVTEGTAINVNGTVGISKDATIRMRGLQKNSETTACVVSAVSGSTSAGTITLQNGTLGASSAKPVRVGAKIYVDGSSSLIYLSCDLNIQRFSAASQTIYIDLNKILTEGTAS